jgi:hypothetical protein
MRITTVPYPSLINPIQPYDDRLSRFVTSTLGALSFHSRRANEALVRAGSYERCDLGNKIAAQVVAFARISLVLLEVQLPHA